METTSYLATQYVSFNEDKYGIQHDLMESEGDRYLKLDLASEDDTSTEPSTTIQAPVLPSPEQQSVL